MLPTYSSKSSQPLRPLTLSLCLLSAVARLVPHPPNVTPVGGLSLFGGARLPGWQAYLMPLLVMSVTNPSLAVLHGYPVYPKTTLFVYAGFLVSVWIGRRLRRSENALWIGGAVFLCSLQFFLLTNFGWWLTSAAYPKTWAGLLWCYWVALPFFGHTLGGDLLYSAILFGLHAWLSRTMFPREKVAKVSRVSYKREATGAA